MMIYKSLILLFLLTSTIYGENMTIADIQRIALSENPRIKAMDKELIMMKKRISQSSSLDDPRLKLGINNLPINNFSFKREDMTSKEIGISQMIPLGGKLGSKERIAVLEYNKSVEKLRKERIEVLHEVRMNIYELVYIKSSIKILLDIKKQIKLVIDSEIAANKAGVGSLSNVIKANIEYTTVDKELISLKQTKQRVQQQLSYLIGKKIDIGIDKLPEFNLKDLDFDYVKNEIQASNPDLKMFRLDADISKEEIKLKKKEYYPDMELGLSYMQRDNSASKKRDDMISGMVSFNIPLWFWSKNIPMVDEMKNKNASTHHLYEDKSNDLNLKAEILLSKITKWKELYKLYHDELIPAIELALKTNLARYRSSSIEFMPVIDSVRMLLRYKKDIIMVQKEYFTSFSELYALMGIEVLP